MANEVRINVTSRDRSGPGMQSARTRADQLGQSTRRVGEIAAGILTSQVFERIASAAQRAFTDTIRASSNLSESINAVNVVFEDAAGGVLGIGENASQSMGLSKRAFNEAAVAVSNFAQIIAGEGGDVAGIVENITQRAADFASVMNIDVEQALGLFQSALAGETEPLRRYGIDVSAAAVQTFAYAEGLAEAGAELTEQEKVQARYGLIMQSTSKMQGDFANTSDDLANATRRAGAELENAQASLGDNLLPVLGAAASAAADMLVGFQELPGPLQSVVGVLVAAAALAPGLAVLRGVLASLQISIRGVLTVAGPVGLAVAALGTVLAVLGSRSREAAEQQQELAGLLQTVGQAAEGQERAVAAAQLQQSEIAETAKTLGVDLSDLTDIVLGDADAMEALRGRLESVAAETELVVAGGEQLVEKSTEEAEAAQELIGWLEGLEGATTEEAAAQQELAAATGEATEEITKAAEEAATSWSDSISEMVDANQALQDANSELEEDQELTTAAFIEQFERRLQVARDHNENIVAVQQRASEDVREQMLADLQENPELAALIANASTEEFGRIEDGYREKAKLANAAANREFVRNIPALRSIASRSGRAVAENIAGAIRAGRPLSIAQTRRLMSGVKSQAERERIRPLIRPVVDSGALARVMQQLDTASRPRTAVIRSRISGPLRAFETGGIVGQAQAGGPRGQDVLVGEAGPEIAELPLGTRVIPSGQTQAQLGGDGFGGGTTNVVLELHSSGSRLDDLLVEVLRTSIRVKGGDVQTVLGAG